MARASVRTLVIAWLGVVAVACDSTTQTKPAAPITVAQDSGVPQAGGDGAQAGATIPIAGTPAIAGAPARAAESGGARAMPPSPPSVTVEDDLDAGAPPSRPETPPVFEADGEPLAGKLDTWTFIEFPDTQCRDGSSAGLFLNLGHANKLMIFFEGGGRCANEQTCAALNAANIQDGELVRGVARAGVLDRTRAENPVRDWNFVYVPYCTGDRHGGANPAADVPAVGAQHLVGYSNLRRLLNRIVPTFRDATDVLVTGISAGGFGAAYAAPLIQHAFPNLKLKVVIDSAPFVSTKVFTECDQVITQTLYRADETFLAQCGAACQNPKDWWLDYGAFFAKTFADRPTGLISTTEDLVERALFGIGAEDCRADLDLLNPGISAATFRRDVIELRTTLGAYPNFATFYPDADTHTFLAFDEFYTVRAGDVRLVDWFAKLVNGESPGHAGP